MPRPIGTTFADLLGKLTDAHVASALLNEVLKRIPTEAPAFRALHPHDRLARRANRRLPA
jgi:hypothetical protein